MAQRAYWGPQGISLPTTLYSYMKAGLSSLMIAGLLTGCVSSEKYEQEKARSLNFQRLLAQEEKRTGELNVKFQDAQRQVASLETQTRDLNAELEAVRNQLNRSHDELSRVREGDMETPNDLKLSEPSISEFGLGDLDFKDSDLTQLDSDLSLDSIAALDSEFSPTPIDAPVETHMDTRMDSALGGMHTVEKGETLYRISRQYGVSVQDLKSWNNLSDNTIHVGQQLIVSHR